MKNSVLLIACIAGLSAAALAQPAYMNYQGRLLDAIGQPLTNGSYKIEFNIYSSASTTNPVWGPFLCDDDTGDGHAARAVVANGRFNVILGAHDTAGRPLAAAFLGDYRFVEMKVNDGAPILPRQQVLSAPYALQSTSARTAEVASNLVQQVADTLCPPGSIVAFGGPTVPAGWLPCNGGSLPTTGDYARLFGAIGYSWGGSGGSFNLPDLRGMFLRGVNGARTGEYADPNASNRNPQAAGGNVNNNVGSIQVNQFKPHKHRWAEIDNNSNRYSRSLWSWDFAGNGFQVLRPFVAGAAGSANDDDSFEVIAPINTALYTKTGVTVEEAGETRPNNAYVNYIIKY